MAEYWVGKILCWACNLSVLYDTQPQLKTTQKCKEILKAVTNIQMGERRRKRLQSKYLLTWARAVDTMLCCNIQWNWRIRPPKRSILVGRWQITVLVRQKLGQTYTSTHTCMHALRTREQWCIAGVLQNTRCSLMQFRALVRRLSWRATQIPSQNHSHNLCLSISYNHCLNSPNCNPSQSPCQPKLQALPSFQVDNSQFFSCCCVNHKTFATHKRWRFNNCQIKSWCIG